MSFRAKFIAAGYLDTAISDPFSETQIGELANLFGPTVPTGGHFSSYEDGVR